LTANGGEVATYDFDVGVDALRHLDGRLAVDGAIALDLTP
jgi:hypothetical protein